MTVSRSLSTHLDPNSYSQTENLAGVFDLGRRLCQSVENDRIQEANDQANILLGYGRVLIAHEVLHDQSTHALRGALDLVAALENPRIQFDDDLKYALARTARLFLELTCMQVYREERHLYPKTVADLSKKLETVASTTTEEQVALRHELVCAREALKAMTNPVFNPTIQDLVKFIFEKLVSDGGFSLELSSIPKLIKKGFSLLSELSPPWFPNVLYASWMGSLCENNPEIFKQILDDLCQNTCLETYLTRIQICSELVFRGNDQVQRLALKELCEFAGFKKRFVSQWPVRLLAVKALGAATGHDSAFFRGAAHETLLQRRIDETNTHVLSILGELEHDPTAKIKWRQLLEIHKCEILERQRQEETRLLKVQYELEQKEIELRKAGGDIRSLRRERLSLQEEQRVLRIQQGNYSEAYEYLMKSATKVIHEILDTQTVSCIDSSFCCPITKEVFYDPVVAQDGHTYEREAIETAMKHSLKSPLTGEQFISTQLLPNHSIRQQLADKGYKVALLRPNLTKQTVAKPSMLEPATSSAKQDLIERMKKLGMMITATPSIPEPATLSAKPSTPEPTTSSAKQDLIERMKKLGMTTVAKPSTPELATLSTQQSSVEHLTQLAKLGNADAQVLLGDCYQNGRGVPVDFKKATHYYCLAAKNGNATGQRKLGWNFINGKGMERDPKEAMRWITLAAENGNIDAQADLGGIYAFNYELFGIDINYGEAVKWLRKAAKKEHPGALWNLASCYESGYGVSIDPQEAKRLSVLTFEINRRRAESADPCGLYDLGQCYWCGKGVATNLGEAKRCFREAAEKGHSAAQLEVAEMCRRDLKYKEMIDWYQKAIKQGNATACRNFGLKYQNGIGVPQDDAKAAEYFLMGAKLGNSMAQREIGLCFKDGKGVIRDLLEAIKWLRLAASQGDSVSKRVLGRV